MARVNTLSNFLTDVADAIRTKTGSQATIQASSFDTVIENITSLSENIFDIEYMTQKNYNKNGIDLGQNYYINNNGTLKISRSNGASGRTSLNKLDMLGTYTIGFNLSASGTRKSIAFAVENMNTLNDICFVWIPLQTDPQYYSYTFTLNANTPICIAIMPDDSQAGTISISDITLRKYY